MGTLVSAAILSGNVSKAHRLSMLINLGGKATERFARATWGGKTIIMGGDDMMIEVESGRFTADRVEAMRKKYKSTTGATLSCGIGSTPEEAMRAIVIAKNTGKNKAVFWEPSMDAEYKRVVKARMNDLKTKLRAQGGKVNESADPPPGLRGHVRKIMRTMLRGKVKQNRRLAKNASRTEPGAKSRATDSPGASSLIRRAAERRKKIQQQHKPQMLATMRDYLVHRQAEYNTNLRKADALSAMGHHKLANAFRVSARLVHHKTMADRHILHTAAQARDPSTLHFSIRGKVAKIRNSMAARMKATRAGRRQADEVKSVLSARLLGKKTARNLKNAAASSSKPSDPGVSHTTPVKPLSSNWKY
jgi:hypothetical protein